MNALAEAGGLQYLLPQPVPRMTYYQRKYGYVASKYPNAAYLSDAGIALPVGPHLATSEIEIIATTLTSIMKSY